MRTHFPGALREVRSAARFPLSVVGVWIPDEWRASASAAGAIARMESQDGFVVRHSFLTNSKEEEHMDKTIHHRSGGACPR